MRPLFILASPYFGGKVGESKKVRIARPGFRVLSSASDATFMVARNTIFVLELPRELVSSFVREEKLIAGGR